MRIRERGTGVSKRTRVKCSRLAAEMWKRYQKELETFPNFLRQAMLALQIVRRYRFRAAAPISVIIKLARGAGEIDHADEVNGSAHI